MRWTLALLLVVIAIAGRLAPHPDNFTPLLAVALFAGAALPGALAWLVPLAALAASDLVLGHEFTALSIVVYAAMLGGAALGRWLGSRRTWLKTGFAALAGSLFFFVVTNFAVWLIGHGQSLYPRTLEGLIDCYAAALPFLRNGLAGDLFWTAVLFGLFDLASGRARLSPRVPQRRHT